MYQLYINNQEVNLTGSTDINFNYQQSDLQNPTIIKSSFSKTVTVPGNTHNSNIFCKIFDLQMVNSQATGYFNPAKKADFKLFKDGVLLESGYAKLDSVTKNNGLIFFNLTLYGGLGDLFYNLSYNENGDKLTLADMFSSDLDFVINRDTVNSAWTQLQTLSGNSKWNTINFAPTYNGIPDNFDADKVLINLTGTTFDTSLVDESDTAVTYTPRYGYALGELGNDMTGLEIHDLRSWMQTPVLRVKSLISACCDTTKNGGWTVNLDTDFFNSNNPYYNDAWITLPAISDLEYAGYNEYEGGFALGNPAWNGWAGTYPVSVTGNVNTNELNTPVINFSFSITGWSGTYNDYLYCSKQYPQGPGVVQIHQSFMVQLVAYDENNRVVAASNVYNFTSPVGGQYIPMSYYKGEGWYAPAGGVNREKVITGQFHKGTGDAYVFESSEGTNWDISLGQNVAYSYLRLIVTKVGLTRGTGGGEWSYSRITGSDLDWLFPDQSTYSSKLWCPSQTISIIANSSQALYPSGEQIASGAKIPKDKLLKSENTPAEYLIGYTKLFGLYYNVHIDTKTVDIMLRNNYYDGYMIDINEFVDRGQEIKIVPLTYDKKFYDLKYKEDDGSMFLEQYKDTYNKTYGQQRINTSYEFNNDSKNLLDNIPYQSAVEALEKSKYYRDIYTRRLSRPIWIIDEWQYTLWNYDSEGGEYNSYSKDMPAVTPNSASTYWNTMDGYDVFPKLQFRDDSNSPVDCKNVLVFFNGFQSLINAKGATIPMWLTDENNHMMLINEQKPCWLYTESETNANGENIAKRITSLPMFGRYRMNNNQIDLSWDFGEPLELYSPTYVSNPQSTIYNQYWKDYITDLYSENTRVVTCYVYCSRPLSKQDLRHFYFFDNSYWVINKIIDYNPNKQLTKMEFVKVNSTQAYTTNLSIDSNDYLNVIPTSINFLSDLSTLASIQTNMTWGAYIVYEDETGDTYNASISSTNFDLLGGSSILTINASNGLSWTITKPAWVTASSIAGTGSGTVNLTIPESSSGRTGNIVVSGSNGVSTTFSISQQSGEVVVTPSTTAYTINPNSSGIVYTVSVNANVPYTVSASTNWLSATTGNGGVEFIALSNNTGTTPRNSVISLIYSGSEKATISVTQMAEIVSNWALFSNNTTAMTYTFTSAATIGSFVEESMTSNVEYTVVSNQDWLSAETTSTGIQFTVLSENETGSERQGSLSIKYEGEILAVATIKQQQEPEVIPFIQPETNLVEFGYSEGGYSGETVVVNATSGLSWTASTTSGFGLTLYPNVQVGTGQVKVLPTVLTGDTDLTGTIDITGESGTSATINLIRYRPSIMISESAYTADCHSTSFTIDITALTDFTIVSEDDTWIVPSITGGTTGVSSVTITVAKNEGSHDKNYRSGNIWFYATYLGYTTQVNCTVYQTDLNLGATLSRTSFPIYSGVVTLDIVTDMEWDVTVPSWMKLPDDLIGSSGVGSTAITIEYSSTTSSRSGSVYVYDHNDHSFYVKIDVEQPYVTVGVQYQIGGWLDDPDFNIVNGVLESIYFSAEMVVNWTSVDAGAGGSEYNVMFYLMGCNSDYSEKTQIDQWSYDSESATPTASGNTQYISSFMGSTHQVIDGNYDKYELRIMLEPKNGDAGLSHPGGNIVQYSYSGGTYYSYYYPSI